MNAIAVQNLGPIAELSFQLDKPGVTVLTAPNGSGKSILLDAVQTAARGKGKLPLRDRAKRGKVEVGGATITIGGTCRHTGEFEVAHLEGKFDLSALVDPKLKSPEASDAARIKALVALTGAKADPNLFRQHEAFRSAHETKEGFDETIGEDATETDDLVEMARRIKAKYDAAARQFESHAEREDGHASALCQPSELDLTAESDPDVLQREYDQARDSLTVLEERRRRDQQDQTRIAQARQVLSEHSEQSLIEQIGKLTGDISAAGESIEFDRAEIRRLEEALGAARKRLSVDEHEYELLCERRRGAESVLVSIEAANKVIAEAQAEPVTDEQIRAAEQRVEQARAAVSTGVLIRKARADAQMSQHHRENAAKYRRTAERYRDAGRATDEVLSAAIQCDRLRIESDGKSARLVVDTDRGKGIPYHDLSDGERWTIAIDLAADQVGAGGLVVIDQVGWEGIDGQNRRHIHEHAVSRGVYVLTAEASQDPSAAAEIVPMPFGSEVRS